MDRLTGAKHNASLIIVMGGGGIILLFKLNLPYFENVGPAMASHLGL